MLYTGERPLPSTAAYDDARNNGPWAPAGVPPRQQQNGTGGSGPFRRQQDGIEPLEAAAFAVLGNDGVPTSVAGVAPHGGGRNNRRHNADANDNRL